MAGVFLRSISPRLLTFGSLLFSATGLHADDGHQHDHAAMIANQGEAATPFPTSIADLPDAVPATMIRLGDGDEFDAGHV